MWVDIIINMVGFACVYRAFSLYLLGTMLNASFNPQHIPVSRYYTVSPHFYVEMGMEKSNSFLKVIVELGVKLGAFPAVC